MAAPTEKEIRGAIARLLERGMIMAPTVGEQSDYPLEDLFVFDIWCAIIAAAEDAFDWKEFRPSEKDRFDTLANEATARWYARALPDLVKEVTAAALQFTAEHPDAPRAKATVTA